VVLKAFDDYKQEYEIKEGSMTTEFFQFMDDRYGIEILLEGNTGYIRAAYNIKDNTKHNLFVLKYGHILGDT